MVSQRGGREASDTATLDFALLHRSLVSFEQIMICVVTNFNLTNLGGYHDLFGHLFWWEKGGCHHLSINHLVFLLPDGCFVVGIVDIEISNAPIASGKFGKCRILPFFFTPSLIQAILKLDTLPFLIRKKGDFVPNGGEPMLMIIYSREDQNKKIAWNSNYWVTMSEFKNRFCSLLAHS